MDLFGAQPRIVQEGRKWQYPLAARCTVSSWFSLVFAVWIWLVVVFAPVFFSICICVGQDNLGGSKLAKTVARFSGSSGNWKPSISQNSHLKKYWNKPEIILLGHDSDVLCKTNPTLHSILGEAIYWHTKKSEDKDKIQPLPDFSTLTKSESEVRSR